MYLQKRVEPIPLPPRPTVLSPTGSFDGGDGKWSTFFINTGDLDGTGIGQNFKVLISTSFPITIVPQLAEWCDEDCAKARGVLPFKGKQPLGVEDDSPSWKASGTYDLPVPYWFSKNLTSDPTGKPGGLWGLENVGLGESSEQSPVLREQYVAKYTAEEFFMGLLGMANGEAGPPGATKPTFLDTFYTKGAIASRSYGYTAGAYYRNNNGVLGSLVLGGFDKSRMKNLDQGTSIDMPSDKNTTLVVGVQSILYAPKQRVEANTFSFTDEGFSAVIDSTLSYLVLPDYICDQFAQRFRLTFEDDRQIYTVNSSSHEWNKQQEATVSFKIGAGPRDSDMFASIELPYAAFDQQLSLPSFNETTQYFPIKRSENGVYVLGRTFLQEAYIIVDYERSNFTVAPIDTDNMSKQESLVTIFNTTYKGITPQPDSGGGLSTGAIAGIVVGIVLAFIIAGIGAFFFWKRRRNAKKASELEKASEIDTVTAGNEVKHRRVSELTGSEGPRSPKDLATGYYTSDNKWIAPISEMSPESTPAELYSPRPGDRNEGETYDYFATGRMRRRGATRDKDSSGYTTPGTPIAELPGDEGRFQAAGQHPDGVSPIQRPKHSRGPSDTSLSTNIDEVLASKQQKEPESKASAEGAEPAVVSGEPATSDEIAKAKADTKLEDTDDAQRSALERRPSHARGLSDTTVQSDSTAISQPTPEELERWATSADDGPQRPMSP